MGQLGNKCSIDFGCVFIENELEIISHILNGTKLSQLYLGDELKRFLDLFSDKINDEEVLSYDTKNNIYEYVDSILIINSTYIEAQRKYFSVIVEKYKYLKKVVCMICLIIIFQTIADAKEKINMLYDTINKFYGNEEKGVKEFIQDVIELNTVVCKTAFSSYFDPNELKKIDHLFEYYRIERLFCKIMLNHYDKNSSHSNSYRER